MNAFCTQRKLKKAVVVTLLAATTLTAVLCVYRSEPASEELLSYPDWVDANINNLWSQWKTNYSKVYSAADEAIRMATFIANLKIINAHNSAFQKFSLALNEYADLTSAEWVVLLSGGRPPLPSLNGSIANTSWPASLDWRTRGYVNAIQNQGPCGSCWAHASTATMEAIAKKKTGGELPVLSRQQLLDCSGAYGNSGCGGGSAQGAFLYAMHSGIGLESAYPYTAQNGTCKNITTFFKPSNFGFVNHHNPTALKQALQNGPVVVYLEADQSSFQFYSSGIYDDPHCYALDEAHHAVALVGYNETSWYIRNSWGTSWGVDGYMYISNDPTHTFNGICGIYKHLAVYSTG